MQVCIQSNQGITAQQVCTLAWHTLMPEALDLSPSSATRTYVNGGKLLKFSMPQFTPLYTGDNVLWGLM